MGGWIEELIGGSLITVSVVVFAVGLAVRLGLQTWRVAASSLGRRREGRPVRPAVNLIGLSAPLHRLALKKPLYSGLRAVYHLGLVILPVFLSGHILLWEESSLGWSWPGLPDAWADRLTLGLLAATAWFVVRRLSLPRLLRNTAWSNWLLLVLVLAAFGSGYAMSHGTLDGIDFFSENIATIHFLAGELLLLASVFLFWSVRQDKSRCVGCAGCSESCPTGALAHRDADGRRRFDYGQLSCLCCGNCVAACPEEAMELRHELRLAGLYKSFIRPVIGLVELDKCESCGAVISPDPQTAHLDRLVRGQELEPNYLHLCRRCRALTRPSPAVRANPES